MTIGKRKGIAAKGAFNPAQPGDKVGGSLSKGDHWYIQQAFHILVEDTNDHSYLMIHQLRY